ncbi:trimeric intracellular cation channel family protein [Marininema halotolerans]|uniref:Uncharacterized membrane protein YeiH n=1 Tax=Marininema halotolerans TaxID=1155944 RepID=A0A1I6T135_9BACL|nr:trimeric intracellular cation channel family protein [Marininema halotolerans]SFS82768.1 Uncharacterized membrane protein YeiH [Marininema halotolerans]
MVWDTLNVIGVIAFAASGALTALEEKYDLFGVWVLGFVTAFGGGVIRNLLIGVPIRSLWEQHALLYIAFGVSTLLFILPASWLLKGKGAWVLFDAIGLSAFSIQGGLTAAEKGLPLIAVATAAILTGIGGGVIRDVLAGRKPLVFRKEIYAAWALLAGVLIQQGVLAHQWQLYLLFLLIVTLRMVSLRFRWHLPQRPFLKA